LDRVGCFPYSPVEGAIANDVAEAVPEDVKLERHERFMTLAAEISAARLQRRIGQLAQVLIDEIDHENGVAIARSKADAPEIDGNVFIEGAGAVQLLPGSLVQVKITDADEYDLFAELI
jgi:ribosomal protein S12 methylthiotransferase